MPTANKKFLENVTMPKPNISMKCFKHTCLKSYSEILFPLHYHDNIELILVTKGRIQLTVESTDYTISEGDTALINPNQYHSSCFYEDNSELYCIQIDNNLLQSHYLDAIEEKFITPVLRGNTLFSNKIEADTEIADIIYDLYDTYYGESFGYELKIKSLLYKLLFLLYRSYVQKALPQEQYLMLSMTRERINALLDYIHTHYREQIRLTDLVDVVHINKYYICKIFSHYTGQSILKYVNNYRLEKAIELLLNTNMTISQIAYEVGFSDFNYFSRIFKEFTHTTPSALRKKWAANNASTSTALKNL